MTDDERAAMLTGYLPLVAEFISAIRIDFRYTERMAKDASNRLAAIARVEDARARRQAGAAA